MRYLKIYENFNKKDLFLKLYNEYLVFLIDEGFEIFDDSENKYYFSMFLCKPDYSENEEYTFNYFNFSWDVVKYDLLPFVEMLNINKILINEIRIEFTTGPDFTIKKNKLEEFNTNKKIQSIYINILK